MSKEFRPRPSRGRRRNRGPLEEPARNGSNNRNGGGWRWGPLAPGWRLIGILFVLIGFILVMVDTRVRPSIAAVAESVARRTATEAVNDALQNAVAGSPDDGKILHVETDKAGNIRLATFDFRSVSLVQAEATRESEDTLAALSRETFSLPISQTVGGPLFSVFTPELPVRIHLVGSAHSTVRMDVKSIGINQSVHALYLDVEAEVQAVAPLVSKPIEIKTSVPLAYVVLSGEIPDTYVGPSDNRPPLALPVLPPPQGH